MTNEFKIGDSVAFDMPDNQLHGVTGRIYDIRRSQDGDDYCVMTTQCVGASPAGIRYIVRKYELKRI